MAEKPDNEDVGQSQYSCTETRSALERLSLDMIQRSFCPWQRVREGRNTHLILVRVNHQDAQVLIEDVHRAVAMVDIKVEDQHLPKIVSPSLTSYGLTKSLQPFSPIVVQTLETPKASKDRASFISQETFLSDMKAAESAPSWRHSAVVLFLQPPQHCCRACQVRLLRHHLKPYSQTLKKSLLEDAKAHRVVCSRKMSQTSTFAVAIAAGNTGSELHF